MKALQTDMPIWMVLIVTILSLCLYFPMTFRKKDGSSEALSGNAHAIYKQRLWGAIAFGGIPVLVSLFYPISIIHDFGLILRHPAQSAKWLVFLSTLIISLCIFRAKSPDNLTVYPQIRTTTWDIGMLVFSALSWAAYLFCYEFFFRGFLLFSSVQIFDPVWAIVINIVVYVLAHLPKGKFEMIGSVPVGLILCLITLETGSIWVAFGSHLVMALTTEWASIYFHDSMRIVLKSQR